MKLFSYLLIACAGIGLLACSTENDPAINSGKEKSVTLVLDGITTKADTKAINTPTSGAPGNTEIITLSDIRVIFYNKASGTIYRMADLTSTSPDWLSIISPSGLTYHNLNQAIDAVMIIGNKTGKNFDWSGDADEIKASKLWAANENTLGPTPGTTTKDYVTLFGTTEVNDVDNYFQASTSPTTDPTDNHPLYNAKVKVKPLVARFEIGNISCTNLTSALYSYITLKTIGLIEFSQQATVYPRAISTRLMATTHIKEPGTPTTPVDNIVGPFEFGNATAISWAYDAIPKDGANFVKLDNPADVYNPNGTTASPNGTLKFAYNFFPDVAGFPNIKLVMDEVQPLDPLVTVPWRYVTTAKFSPTLTPTAGNIYKIDLNFLEINIGPWDPTAIICVNLQATVMPWTIVALTPLYQ